MRLLTLRFMLQNRLDVLHSATQLWPLLELVVGLALHNSCYNATAARVPQRCCYPGSNIKVATFWFNNAFSVCLLHLARSCNLGLMCLRSGPFKAFSKLSTFEQVSGEHGTCLHVRKWGGGGYNQGSDLIWSVAMQHSNRFSHLWHTSYEITLSFCRGTKSRTFCVTLINVVGCIPPPRPHWETQRSSGRNSGRKHFTDGEKVTALPIRQFPLFIGNDQSLFLPDRPPLQTEGGRQRDFLQISCSALWFPSNISQPDPQ